jgi:predicted lipid-binding transport protein (Tim44 family)
VNAVRYPDPPSVRKTKRIVGAIAVALLMIFTVLAIRGILSFLDWILGDLIVALVANWVFRRVDRQAQQPKAKVKS